VTDGYHAIGIVGIASAPARTMMSEQTVARIGRLMNVSTNIEVEPRDLGLEL
jgi:hypothetical protein